MASDCKVQVWLISIDATSPQPGPYEFEITVFRERQTVTGTFRPDGSFDRGNDLYQIFEELFVGQCGQRVPFYISMNAWQGSQQAPINAGGQGLLVDAICNPNNTGYQQIPEFSVGAARVRATVKVIYTCMGDEPDPAGSGAASSGGNARIVGHELRHEQQRETDHNEHTDFAWYGGDYRLCCRISATGARMHGHVKAKIEDAGSGSVENNASGKSFLTLDLDGCNCEEFQGVATIAVRHVLRFSAAVAPGTITKVKGRGTADTFGITTALTLDLEGEQVDDGDFEIKTEGHGEVHVDKSGEVTGIPIPGLLVSGGENVSIDGGFSVQSHRRRRHRVGDGGVDAAVFVHTFTHEVPLQCGRNELRTDSNLSMGMSSAVTLSSNGEPRDTGWLESSAEFDIENEISVVSVRVTDCHGRRTTLQIPERVTRGSLVSHTAAPVHLVDVPDVVREQHAHLLPADELEIIGHSRAIAVRLSSSRPNVIAPEQPVLTIEPGAPRTRLTWRALEPGAAELMVAIPELRDYRVAPVVVEAWDKLSRRLHAAPSRIAVIENGYATVTLFRSAGPASLEIEKYEVVLSDHETVDLLTQGRFPAGANESYIGIIGKRAGSASLQVKLPGAEQIVKVPIEVVAAEKYALIAPDRLRIAFGHTRRLYFETSHPVLEPPVVRISIVGGESGCVVLHQSDIELFPLQRAGSVQITGQKAGLAVLKLQPARGAAAFVKVFVEG